MAIADFTPEGLRRQFDELTGLREARLSASTPLREARDLAWNNALERRAREDAAIKAIENPDGQITMFDLDMARAAVARALKGITGDAA